MLQRIFILALAFLTIGACNGEQRRLVARRTELERRQRAIEQRVDTGREVLRDAQQRLDRLNATLAEHNGTTRAYIVQNQTAAACIRAAAITFGNDTESRAQVGAIAGLGTALCTAALLSRSFATHVADVANVITHAEKRAREMKSEIEEIRRTIDADEERVRRAQQELEQVERDLDDVRGQLASQ
jgi:peptidoglycan hydrolase CwlO-like protein